MNNENGKWITLENGVHVFIKDGQSVEDAIKENFDNEDISFEEEDSGEDEFKTEFVFDDEVEDKPKPKPNLSDNISNEEYTTSISRDELPKLNKIDKPKETAKLTNPYRSEHISKDKGRESNCQKCCLAFELRMRGYNVIAKPFNPFYKLNNDGQLERVSDELKPLGVFSVFGSPEKPKDYIYYLTNDFNVNDLEDFFIENQDTSYYLGKNLKQTLEEQYSRFPNSRWIISVKWKGNQGRHVFMACVDKNGKTTFVDPQNGEKVTNDTHWKYITNKKDISTFSSRLDNKDFDDKVLGYYVDKGE